MKVKVSYISSKYDARTTIEKIDECKNADAIHVDLMDGLFVPTKNFEKEDLISLFKDIKKPLDVHLMVENPENYLDTLFKLNVDAIYFHPSQAKDPMKLIYEIKDNAVKAGIVINLDENPSSFKDYYSFVDKVLIMSVYPGKGGQKFLRESLVNYEFIKDLKKNYHFEIYVDGGINDETIKYVKDADGVISGSFVCKSDDYQSQINKLKVGQE